MPANPPPLHIELESDPAQLTGVRDRLCAWTRAAGWSEPQIGEIVLAVDEALTNVIRHGYQCQPARRIVLSVAALAGPTGVEIRVRDFGQQIDPAEIHGRPLDDIRPGGLGVHIIRAMMSSVEYSCAEGGGMLLVMRKYRDHRAASAPVTGDQK